MDIKPREGVEEAKKWLKERICRVKKRLFGTSDFHRELHPNSSPFPAFFHTQVV